MRAMICSLVKLLGERDLDRAIERQLACCTSLRIRTVRGQREVAAQHRAAETLAGDFDLLGQRDFFGPR